MAQNQNRPQGQQKRGGRGPQSRVYIFSVEAAPTAGEKDKYDLKVTLDVTGPASFRIPTRIFVGTDHQGVIDVQGRTLKNINGIKLDLSQDVISVRIEKAGFPGEGDTFELRISSLKKSAAKSTPTAINESKWFKVIVGPLSPDNKNPVTFLTYDEQGKPGVGEVIVNAGQKLKLMGKTYKAGELCSVVNKPDGRMTTSIQLLECDATVAFTHVPSGDTIRKSLLKER